MKYPNFLGLDLETMKDVQAKIERLEAEARILGDEKCLKQLKRFKDWAHYSLPGWKRARLLFVRQKLHLLRFSAGPSVDLDREQLEMEIRELEKSLLWDRRVMAVLEFLLLAACACGTMLIAFEGCLLEPIGLSCVFACWGVTAMVIWCLRE